MPGPAATGRPGPRGGGGGEGLPQGCLRARGAEGRWQAARLFRNALITKLNPSREVPEGCVSLSPEPLSMVS